MVLRDFAVVFAALALVSGAGAWTFVQSGQTPRTAAEAPSKPQGKPQDAAKAQKETEEGDEEVVIALDKAPAPVQAAALKLVGDAKNITKVIQEEDEKDMVMFEVEYNDGAGAAAIKCSAVFSPAGDLMEIERSTTEAKLPAAVLAALKKDFPKATFTDPCTVTKMYYEVDVVIDGKKHEVKIDAAGNIEDESDGEAEQDEKKGEKDKD